MKYTILGFQQEKLIQEGLKVDDALLLNVIKDMYGSSAMDFKEIDGVRYMWVNYTWLLSQIPIIGSKSNLNKKIKKYSECDLLLRVQEYTRKGKKGSYAYISPTKKLFELQDYQPYVKFTQGVCKNDIGGVSNLHSKDTSIIDTPIKDKNITQNVSNYDNLYQKIISITGLNLFQVQNALQPIKLKGIDIDKVISEIDKSDYLLKQNNMSGFRKYFSTIQQIKKIEMGYYANEGIEKVNKANAKKKQVVETLQVKGWEL